MPRKNGYMRNFLGTVTLGLAMMTALLPAHAAPAAKAASGQGLWAHRSALTSNTPPDSYLQYRVYTVDQLIQQVQANPMVRARFANTFGVPQSRLVTYMRSNLVESYIPKTARYTVYCVRPSGRFYAIHQTFTRGTRVFALRNGEPVMKWICGNPLAHYLPSVQVISYRPQPVIHVANNIQELTPSEMQHVIVPAEIPAPKFQPMVPVQVASASTSVVASAGAAALGAAMITVASSSHHNSPLPTPGPVVPEAPPVAYLLIALPAIALMARRRLSGGIN